MAVDKVARRRPESPGLYTIVHSDVEEEGLSRSYPRLVHAVSTAWITSCKARKRDGRGPGGVVVNL
jgi:hypothetical protein